MDFSLVNAQDATNTNKDASWIIKAQYQAATSTTAATYLITTRGMRYIFESEVTRGVQNRPDPRPKIIQANIKKLKLVENEKRRTPKVPIKISQAKDPKLKFPSRSFQAKVTKITSS